jgi:protease I
LERELIACICHGIEILTAADCIRGKRVTTVPKCAMDAEQGGATYVDENVVIDGLLVTGRGYGENTIVLREFIRMLKSSTI